MAPSTSTPDASKRPANPGGGNRSPTRAGTPSSNNVARTKSIRTGTNSPMTAKGAARKTGGSARSDTSTAVEESKASNAALVDDLKEQLRKAEAASEEYQKQAYVLQTKLDEATNDHVRIEEASQEQLDKVEALEKEKQDAFRRHRDLQSASETDKATALREKEEAAAREEELNEVVQRLKESLTQQHRKSLDGESALSGTANFRGRSSPCAGAESPSSQARDNSQGNSKLIMQKDKVIEALRLELAEAQIRLVEMENADGGRMQELEKKLLESRMNNAKLMEDNESYQVLLSEKTLNGDFSKSNIFESATDQSESSRTPTRDPTSSSLADELDSADTDVSDDPHVRKIESELSAAKDQNKALTLYINKIITRLLQSEQFETLFGDGSLTGEGSTKLAAKSKAKIDEPVDLRDVSVPEDGMQTPPRSNTATSHSSPAKENVAPSLLQRAGSIFGSRQRPRPRSLNPAVANAPVDVSQTNPAQPALPPTPHTANNFLSAPNQDPSTAPSLPLRRTHSGRGGSRNTTMRTHRRATSEWSPTTSTGTYRAPPAGALTPQTPARALSPRGGVAPAGNLQSAPPPLILEDSETHEPESLAVHPPDVASDSGYGESVAGSIEPPGSPRSAAAAALEGKSSQAQRSDTQDSKASAAAVAAGAASWFTGANKQSAQMRPLRLVQEKVEADEAAKKANRSSFMGWFNKGGQGQPGPPVLGSSPPPQTTLSSPPPMARKLSSESRPSSGGIQEEP